MSDPFNILGHEFDVPPTYAEAVRDLTERVERAVVRFEELALRVPAERYTEEEWRVVERAAQDVEQAVDRAEEGYVAMQYDSHAWYRITENLEQIDARLQSAVGIMERVLERGDG